MIHACYLAAMKKSWGFFLIWTALVQFAAAQSAEDDVKKVVNQLFEGMRNADSVTVFSVFAPNAIMQTIAVNKEGKTIVGQNQVNGFASFVGKQKKGLLMSRSFLKASGSMEILRRLGRPIALCTMVFLATVV